MSDSPIPSVLAARGRLAGALRFPEGDYFTAEEIQAKRRVLCAANIQRVIEDQLAICGHLSDEETAHLVSLLTARG